MQRRLILGGLLTTSILTATLAHAFTIGYGKRDIAKAGAGCVGGWISSHGNIAYYRGDTQLLNSILESIACDTAKHRVASVVIHAGTKLVDESEESLITGIDHVDRDLPVRMKAIDWSVRRVCPPEGVLAGRCECDQRNVTVDIWIANKVRLDDIVIPNGFTVASGLEIENFVEKHAEHK